MARIASDISTAWAWCGIIIWANIVSASLWADAALSEEALPAEGLAEAVGWP
ncbi:hypothetical protein CVCC1112_257 [Paenarthrobacter nicotinovorans]|nr:hypothetical protein ANMWB30_33600 [Arthrobacter sp. MWB30]GAT85598.1 hypothetical protein CVCC1112_257 [Paenarthrobacter nicotinovorans]